MAKKKASKPKVRVAKGVKVPRGTEEKLRKKPGSSNAGEYKNVAPGDFAGPAGGAAKYTFPINTLARARNALARAHYAPNPAGIRKAVLKKWPQIDKGKTKKRK